MILFTFTLGVLTKIIIEWYYHIYIITNRKILEVKCLPLFSDVVDNVFLDQVRTTEIDTRIATIVHELFDYGDVVLAFDRPSHEEVFTLRNIKNPKSVGIFLSTFIESMMSKRSIWFTGEKGGLHQGVRDDSYTPKDKEVL